MSASGGLGARPAKRKRNPQESRISYILRLATKDDLSEPAGAVAQNEDRESAADGCPETSSSGDRFTQASSLEQELFGTNSNLLELAIQNDIIFGEILDTTGGPEGQNAERELTDGFPENSRSGDQFIETLSTGQGLSGTNSNLLELAIQNDVIVSEITTGDLNAFEGQNEGVSAADISIDTSLSYIEDSDIDHVHISETSSSTSSSAIVAPSPEETEQRTRKRQRKPYKWAKSVAKVKKNTGQEYTTRNTKELKSAKKVKPPCSDKCRLKCREKFNDADRRQIHKSFWEIGNIDRQRDYFLQCMKPVQPKYRTQKLGSNRSNNYAYHFELNETIIRVCKTFYLNTLDVSSKAIYTTTHKKDGSGVLQSDMRGKHGKGGIKVGEEIKEDIRRHIRLFPTMPSHYCRAQTKKSYIDGSLTIASMYKLYQENCIELGKPFAKKHIYESIFNGEFNIAFFKPKKDQCMTCASYKNASDEVKLIQGELFESHNAEKQLCRSEKSKDVASAALDSSMQVACFDLQAVLSVPCGDVSGFFYKRRLATYNFTIYSMTQNQGHCFTWHEGLGKRGANEIGSCIFEYLKTNPAKTITFYSDNCAGQQKNKFVASLLLHAVNTIASIEEICHKFLVVGHTQNEGDAMHALIEKEKKRCLRSGPIYTPEQLVPIIRLAKKTGKVYSCREMDYKDFFDLKKLQSATGKNFTINTEGDKVSWNNICVLKVMKKCPTKILYKTSFLQEDFKEIDLRYKMRGLAPNIELKKAYTTPPTISTEKKKDLLSLCTSNAIPSQYWNFYKNLPCHTKTAQVGNAASDTDPED